MNNYYFWFAQPSTVLDKYDYAFGYGLAAVALAGILFWVLGYFIRHPVLKIGIAKWRRLLVTTGLIGIVWFAFRYENTPILGRRWWIGLLAVIGLIWLIYILKYMFTKFREEKTEYETNLLKSKYMPKAR